MDPDDFEQPIHHQFNSLHLSFTMKSQVKNLELVKSKAEFDDSILNGFVPFQQKISTFVKQHSYGYSTWEYKNPFSLLIRLKNEEEVFKRQVYSILGMIGEVGGLYDGLLIITGFFLSAYNASTFTQELTKSLVKFQKTPIKET